MELRGRRQCRLLLRGHSHLPETPSQHSMPDRKITVALAGNPNPADPAAKYNADYDGTGTVPVTPDAKKGDWKYMPTWIIMADRNPGGAVDGVAGTIEHSNHKGGDGGCAVVTRVGNAQFYDKEDSSKAGFGDDIYTDSGGQSDTTAFPETRKDTLISPTVSR